MRSSIFNFDLSAPLKGVVTALSVMLIAWIAVPSHLRTDTQLPISDEVANELVVQRYIEEFRQKPVVIVGSSITTMIPAPDCRPRNVATIPLQGRSALTGLEVIRRVGAKPDVVFVEATQLVIGIDETLIEAAFTPVYWRISALIPPLRYTRNWVILFYQKRQWQRDQWNYTVPFPQETVAEWNREHSTQFSRVMSGLGRPSPIGLTLPKIEELVHQLQRQGTRVIFFDPIDPRIRNVSPDKGTRDALRAAFPDIPIVDAPDDEVPIYRHDGEHMDWSSGLQLFNYLMDYAGIPFVPKCQLVGRPVAG